MTARDALEQALAVIRRDQLAAWVQIEDALATLVVECTVGEERFHVAGASRIGAGPAERASACVRTDARTILDLVDGELSLLGAVTAGRLDVTANTSVLLRLARAQRAFAEGAARTRDVRPVLERYRRAVSELA